MRDWPLGMTRIHHADSRTNKPGGREYTHLRAVDYGSRPKGGVGPILAARQKLTGVRLAAGLALEQEH